MGLSREVLHHSPCLFQPSCYNCVIQEVALNLEITAVILESKTFACCLPICSLRSILQNLSLHIEFIDLHSISLQKEWTFTVTFPVRNTLCELSKMQHSCYQAPYIVVPYLADKCYRIHHKHFYSVKIMEGKLQETTAL